MLSDYRAWLASELALLSNASHHAYAFGQANMAKRAIEQLDADGPSSEDIVAARAAVDELRATGATVPPALARLLEKL